MLDFLSVTAAGMGEVTRQTTPAPRLKIIRPWETSGCVSTDRLFSCSKSAQISACFSSPPSTFARSGAGAAARTADGSAAKKSSAISRTLRFSSLRKSTGGEDSSISLVSMSTATCTVCPRLSRSPVAASLTR